MQGSGILKHVRETDDIHPACFRLIRNLVLARMSVHNLERLENLTSGNATMGGVSN